MNLARRKRQRLLDLLELPAAGRMPAPRGPGILPGASPAQVSPLSTLQHSTGEWRFALDPLDSGIAAPQDKGELPDFVRLPSPSARPSKSIPLPCKH